jgi:hypothetical protein
MSRFVVVLAALVLVAPGCSEPKPAAHDPLVDYRLEPATEERPLVEQAIKLTNAVLQDRVPVRLRPAWADAESTDSVPVYLIGPLNVGDDDKVWIPEGERFVLVNQPALREFLGGLTKRDNFPAVLTVILLHEVGHLVEPAAGPKTGRPSSDAGSSKSANDASKDRELAADRFAADQLKAATMPGESVPRFSAAIKVQSALVMLNFDVFSQRFRKHFGDQTNSAYVDQSYSHPNFELRLLTVLNELSPTPQSQQLLDDFLQKRQPATGGGILFDGRSSHNDASPAAVPGAPPGPKH